MDALASGSLTGSQRDELMQQVKQQIAVANAQELLTVSLYIFTNHLWLTECYTFLRIFTENDGKML